MNEPPPEPCENCGTPIVHCDAYNGPVLFVSTVPDKQWLEIYPNGHGGVEWWWHTPERCRATRQRARVPDPAWEVQP